MKDKGYVNIPLETLHLFKPEHRAGLPVYCRLLALVTEEAEISPPQTTTCGLEADRAGVVLGGGIFTDGEISDRIDYQQNSFRYGRDVLSDMGLILLDLSRHGYRMALLGCHKYRKLASVEPRFGWVNHVLGRVEVETEPQAQESELETGPQPARAESQPGRTESQPKAHPHIRGQQLTDPKSEKKSKNKSEPADEADTHLFPALDSVWNYYLAAVEQSPKVCTLTPRRKKVGLDRMRELVDRGAPIENAVKLMEMAIDSITASDWHAGRDPKTNGQKYLDWERHLFGTTEKMEKWLEKTGPIQPKLALQINVQAEWAKENDIRIKQGLPLLPAPSPGASA